MDRCIVEIDTIEQNAAHSHELSKTKEMISQVIGQLKAIEEVSDVQRFAKNNEILAKKLEAEAALRTGLRKGMKNKYSSHQKQNLLLTRKNNCFRRKTKL